MRSVGEPPAKTWPVSADLRAAGHENVVYAHNEHVVLRRIIAIRSTALGPALGGTRFYPYATERLALSDALRLWSRPWTQLRLSAAMLLESAPAGLAFGDGKAVIIENLHS